MMDLKEIIKWFLPCFHILLTKLNKIDRRLTVLFFMFLFFNFCHGFVARVNSDSALRDIRTLLDNSENVDFSANSDVNISQSGLNSSAVHAEGRVVAESGRTFGRPFKKMVAGLLPIIFQLGAATTWAAVATIIGVKTLLVTLAILKLLLIAGAAKLGALFAAKTHHYPKEPWTPQKEIHLHIHNQGGHEHGHDDHITSYTSPWSREGLPVAISPETPQNIAVSPYSGPQTIRTPYGNYVRVEKRRKRRDLIQKK